MRAFISAGLAISVVYTTLVASTPVSASITAPAKRLLLAFEIVESSPATSLSLPCEEYQGSFMDQSAEAMLKRLNIQVAREDRVSAFPDPSLSLGSTLTVCRAPRLSIRDGKISKLDIRTWQSTVSTVLAERGIELGEQDLTSPNLEATLADGDTITITRVALSNVKVAVSLPYSTEIKEDANLEKGKSRIEVEGKNGLRQDTYLVRREDGIEVSRRKTDSLVVSEPTAKVVIKGTKVVQYGSGIASFYSGAGVGPLTAAHRTLPKGTRVRVINIATGASVVVTINDRGPFVDGRVIDLSKDAFSQIGSLSSGLVKVRVEAE